MVLRNLIVVSAAFVYCGLLALTGVWVIGHFERRSLRDTRIPAVRSPMVHRELTTRSEGSRQQRPTPLLTRSSK